MADGAISTRPLERIFNRWAYGVGWDSVRYFWGKKTPEQTASDLSSALLAYSAKWHADRVALIGFSFGADIIPSVYNHLRQSLKDRVPMLSLLSPEPAADWEIRVVGWLGAPASALATPLGPAIDKIPARLIQCFYGKKDSGSCSLARDLQDGRYG